MKDFDDFLNASGDEEDRHLEKPKGRSARGGSPSYRGGRGGGRDAFSIGRGWGAALRTAWQKKRQVLQVATLYNYIVMMCLFLGSTVFFCCFFEIPFPPQSWKWKTTRI